MKIKVIKRDGSEQYVAAQDNTRVVNGAARIPATRAKVSEVQRQSQAKQTQLNPSTTSIQDQRQNDAKYKNQHLWQADPTRQVTRQNAGVEFDNTKNLVKNSVETAGWTAAGGVAANTVFKNYRLFPKANPTSRYRNIGGKEGYQDAIRSGKVRPPSVARTPGKIDLKKSYPYADWGGEGRFVDPTSYRGKYFAEGNTNGINFQRYSRSKWGVRATNPDGNYTNIRIDNPNVTLWKRWNIGQKEILHKQMPK